MKQEHIRNFAIIAHVDHGKSTLADRFLELTKTIPKEKLHEQFLDQNPISRERGITIKLAPVRMLWHSQIRNSKHEILNKSQIQNSNEPNGFGFRNSYFEFSNSEYILNLIDTPGHVDFSYEVSRTLAACEGAILLVDATQGIQAQTIAHFQTAQKEGLILIPSINKIDLPNAQINTVLQELIELGFSKDEILLISAKTGENVEKLLQEVIRKIPAPQGRANLPLRCLIFDAVYDAHQGVVAYVRVVDGNIQKKDKIMFYQSKVKNDVTDVGYFSPSLIAKSSLETGEIGYIITGVKDIRNARVGDTIMLAQQVVAPLPGYTLPKPMVFFGVYPKNANDFVSLRESLAKLTLNDTAITYIEEYSSYLGSGFRVGFLGLLHAEIIKERLLKEFGLDLLLTRPHVLYETVSGEIREPYATLTIYTPVTYVGSIMSLCQKRKGTLLDVSYHESYAVLQYSIPYSMFIRGIASDIKSVSSGFASIDYVLTDYRPADVVKLDILINGSPIDVLSEYVYKDEATAVARKKAIHLKESLPRQQFRQIIQGTVSGTIVAREEISPFRKDVLAKMSGGDRTRKDKLLDKQKKGKSRLQTHAKVDLPQEALYALMGK